MKAAFIVLLAFFVGTTACSDSTEAVQSAGAMPQLENPGAESPAGAPPHTTGKVLETMDAGRYTYVQVDFGDRKIWAAAPKFQVAVGDDVIVPPGTPMTNYHSKTLDRTFDLVYFVAFATVANQGGGAPLPSGHEDAAGAAKAPEIDFAGIEKAEGGKTVAELFDESASLSGQEVTVRGKVVKVTPGVMGKNWLHLQDGTSGADGANDLTVTSQGMAEVGNTVLVRGVVSLDRDFGFGYKYDLIIEDAEVSVE